MTHYYLNVYDSFGEPDDPIDVNLPSLKEARREAIKGIRSLLSEEATEGKIDFRGRIEITDVAGDVLLTIPFEEALEIVRLPAAESDKGGELQPSSDSDRDRRSVA